VPTSTAWADGYDESQGWADVWYRGKLVGFRFLVRRVVGEWRWEVKAPWNIITVEAGGFSATRADAKRAATRAVKRLGKRA
jgi:hypothetical protein